MFDMIKSNPIIWVLLFLAVVAPSFLVGALQVVLYIILGIIILLFVLSLIFNVKIKSMRSRMEEQMRGGAGEQYSSQKRDREGDVKIYTTTSTSEKKVKKDVGDYVDFEEIKND